MTIPQQQAQVTMLVRGVEYPVVILRRPDGKSIWFVAYEAGSSDFDVHTSLASDGEWDRLYDKMMRITKKRMASVEVSYVRVTMDGRIEEGVATGFDSRNDEVRVKGDRATHARRTEVFRADVAPATIERLAELRKQVKELTVEMMAITRNATTLGSLVQETIDTMSEDEVSVGG